MGWQSRVEITCFSLKSHEDSWRDNEMGTLGISMMVKERTSWNIIELRDLMFNSLNVWMAASHNSFHSHSFLEFMELCYFSLSL